MKWFSWIFSRDNGEENIRKRVCTEELEKAGESHKQTMEVLRNGRQTLEETMAQILLIREGAMALLEEGKEIGNGTDE